MICPKCGSELKDDQLYCEVCGEEIQYVPNFDPEIEQSISNTLSNINNNENLEFIDNRRIKSNNHSESLLQNNQNEFIVNEINNKDEYLDDEEFVDEEYIDEEYVDEEYIDEEYIDEEYDDEYDDEFDDDDDYLDDFDEEYDDYYDEEDDDDISLVEKIKEFFKRPKNIVIVSVSFILLVVVLIFGIRFISSYSKNVIENNSYTFQANLAREAALKGDYENAIIYMEKALALNSSDTTMKYDLTQYYFKNNESEKAILILWEVIYGKEPGYENAYGQIVDYYISISDYSMVKEILENCDSNIVVSKYQNYLANAPEFSDSEGTYEDVVYLKLNSSSTGTIYYTIDGSYPTMDSNVYTDPIPLELGKYEISAFFVNSYGVKSEVVSKTYTIDIRVPDAPVCLLEDGEYTSPELIEIDVQKFCTVYYTVDGTTPNKESIEYTGPIPMPVGISHFTFVAYSQEGISGETSEANFSLLLDTTIQITDILNCIKYYNLNMGKTSSFDGNMVGSSSIYTYTVSSAINLDNSIYYILIENIVDSTGMSMKTGTVYLADVMTGQLYKSVKDTLTNLPIRGDLISPELYAPPAPPEPIPEPDPSVSQDSQNLTEANF